MTTLLYHSPCAETSAPVSLHRLLHAAAFAHQLQLAIGGGDQVSVGRAPALLTASAAAAPGQKMHVSGEKVCRELGNLSRKSVLIRQKLLWMCHLHSLGADEVPSEDLVIVSNADDVIGAGPAHAGDQLRVLGLLDVGGLEPHPLGPGPVSVVRLCHGVNKLSPLAEYQ